MSNRNSALLKAKKNPNDEWYTKYEYVNKELNHWKDFLKNKTVYCPCDTADSAFVKWCENNNISVLHSCLPTDFRSPRAADYFKKCDIVITNPPFSLLRELYNIIKFFDKDFILLAPNTCFGYKNIKEDILQNKFFVGYETPSGMFFDMPDGSQKRLGNVGWITNILIDKPELKLKQEFNPTKYPKYDNYDAIEVSRVNLIPKDYFGLMGVPITFMNKYNRKQFEIVELLSSLRLDGKEKFKRFIIRRKDYDKRTEESNL